MFAMIDWCTEFPKLLSLCTSVKWCKFYYRKNQQNYFELIGEQLQEKYNIFEIPFTKKGPKSTLTKSLIGFLGQFKFSVTGFWHICGCWCWCVWVCNWKRKWKFEGYRHDDVLVIWPTETCDNFILFSILLQFIFKL